MADKQPSFGCPGHIMTQKECDYVSNLLKDSFKVLGENRKLRKQNETLESTLKEIKEKKEKTRIYQLDPYRVLVISGDEITYIDGASEEGKVIMRYLR